MDFNTIADFLYKSNMLVDFKKIMEANTTFLLYRRDNFSFSKKFEILKRWILDLVWRVYFDEK